jgi:peptidoglycan/LPS O-acetylase OafA/YrhL
MRRYVIGIVDLLRPLPIGAKAFLYFCNIFVVGSDIPPLVSAGPSGLRWDPFQSPTHNGFSFLVVAPIFSVGLEMLFYVIAPLLVKRTWITVATLMLSLLYHLLIIESGHVNVVYQYHLFPSSLLYFSLGILAHSLYKREQSRLGTGAYLAIVLAGTIILLIRPAVPNFVILLFPFVLPGLFRLTKDSPIDRFIGDLSYPFYLVHYPLISICQRYGVPNERLPIVVTIASLALSLVIHVAFERPIEKLRSRIVRNRQPRAAAVAPLRASQAE